MFPRVLYLGYLPIGSPDNTGLTLGSLFGGWPEDRIFQLCMRDLEGKVPTNVVLAPPSVAPVDAIARRILGRSLRPAPNDGLNQAISRRGQRVPLHLRLRLVASTLNDIGPVHLSRELTEQLEAFEPDLIYTLLGSVRPMRLAASVSKALDVPIVPHFMDDWIDTLFTDGQVFGLGRRAVVRTLGAVLDRSPLCLVIGDDMASEYSERLGRPCIPVGNSVDPEMFRSLAPRRAVPPEPRRLRYVGGLHLGRAAVIRTVAETLGRSHGDRPWILELFVPPADVPLARSLEAESARIKCCGTLHPSQVSQALVDADALLFIESSEPHIARFTRLSVSTKVPQYLAADRPVLVIGPREQASVRVLVESGVGTYAGDGLTPSVVQQALKGLELLHSVHDATSPGSASGDIWERFGIDQVRERLRGALSTAAVSPLTPRG